MVGTLRGLTYVPMVGTYSALAVRLPYVPMVGTGCPHGGYGFLFFASGTAAYVDEQLAIPFLIIARGRLCAVGEIGEAIMRGNTVTIAAEKAGGGFADKAIVLKFLV